MKRYWVLACLMLTMGAGFAQQAGSKLFMWKATAGGSTVYLVGSVHLASPRLYPLPAPMEQAFKDASCLVVEADENSVSQETMEQLTLTYGLCQPPDTMASHVSPSTEAMLQKYQQGMGASPVPFDMMKPWLAAVTITGLELQKNGLDPKQGIDVHFMDEAKTSGKRIDQLESAEFQLKLLSGFSDKLQDAFLVSALNEAPKMNEEFEHMMKAWSQGDAGAMATIVFEDEKNPDLKAVDEALIDKRNVTMEQGIEKYLKQPGTTFVVVGSAHLIGDKGIVSLLQHKGFTVAQMSR